MGVTGLLPALQVQAQKGVRYLKKLRGSAVGIDLAGWLHKFAAKEYRSVVLTKDHTLVVKAVLETAHSYVNAGIKPVFVIDGRHLPGKGGTDAGRLEKRLKAQALVEAALDGVEMDDVIEAVQQGSELPVDIERKTLQAAVAVGDAVITDTIRELRAAGFHVTKAPYEADAQLACYDRLNVTQYTETVDSDLIVYGVRRVLTKVDHSSGTATLFDLSRWSEQTASNEHVPLLKLVRKWGSRVLLFFAVLAAAITCTCRASGRRLPRRSWPPSPAPVSSRSRRWRLSRGGSASASSWVARRCRRTSMRSSQTRSRSTLLRLCTTPAAARTCPSAASGSRTGRAFSGAGRHHRSVVLRRLER
jgi:hypothetical protein